MQELRRFGFRWMLAAAMAAALAVVPASAHEFKMESLINSFVKVDQRELHVVVRLPLHITKTVKFPIRGAEIDVPNAGAALHTIVQGVGQDLIVWEDGTRLVPKSGTARVSLPSDRSFLSYDTAVAHVAEPVDPNLDVYVDQGYVDAHLTYDIRSPASAFSIRSQIAPELKDYLKVAVRYLPYTDSDRALLITSRSGKVALNPSWYQAAGGFVLLGIVHILTGFDHLLFLLCLVIPFLRIRQVIAIVTAFTIAHSFTLLGSAYGLAPSGDWFPPFVETAIAASIVYMALENILGANLGRRWIVTGLFGLVHGFGFSYGLKENLQFAGSHLLVSLFSFNVGIEIGQIAVLAAMLPVLALLRRYVLKGRVGVVLLSALVAHTGWHWMIDRGAILWAVEWPAIDAQALVAIARWTAGILVVGGAATWLVRRLSRRPQSARAA